MTSAQVGAIPKFTKREEGPGPVQSPRHSQGRVTGLAVEERYLGFTITKGDVTTDKGTQNASSDPAEEGGQDGWGDLEDWEHDPYRKRAAQNRLDEQHQTRKVGHYIVEQATRAAEHRHLFQLIVSALLFVGGAWALSRAIILVTTSEPSSISQIDWITLLSPAVFLTLLGFILVAAAIGVSRYPIIRRSLAGISQIQQELASGFGETRPLVQVVQETINNARQTFVVQLRLSQAMFWAGLLFIAVAFYRVLIMGETNWVTTSVTGGAGLFSWIFSYFIAQRGNIQANLADVTQLELGLVGLAKQVTAIDRWLATFLIEPYSLDTKELKESERSTGWALQVIQQGTYAAASLVELYAQVAQGEDEEVKERRKLLNEAVRIHSGLDSDTTRTAN
jgi:hypothetical protein